MVITRNHYHNSSWDRDNGIDCVVVTVMEVINLGGSSRHGDNDVDSGMMVKIIKVMEVVL